MSCILHIYDTDTETQGLSDHSTEVWTRKLEQDITRC